MRKHSENVQQITVEYIWSFKTIYFTLDVFEEKFLILISLIYTKYI